MAIKLTQTASWNAALTNPYRTRYATAAGRYFEVRADDLYGPWFISEITKDGEWMPSGYSGIAFTLAEARVLIEAAIV